MIELCGLCAGYGERVVLHDVSVTFPSGQVSVLIGPNGCGKSTLLKAADGLLAPTRGGVQVDGTALSDLSRKELAQRVAYLPQSRAVSNLTVRQLVLHGRFPYLGYPRRYRPEDHEAAHQAMERVGVTHLAGCSLPQLSGGERQRAYLAMALAQQTEHILLDEPTTFLDVRHQLELPRLLDVLRQEGKTVVLVLHDLNLALRCAQQVVLMEGGRVLAAGTPEQVLSQGAVQRVFGVEAGWSDTPAAGKQYYFY